MAASHLLLQPPPHLHLQVVAIGGHAEMYIKKPMVHRLERQSETELAVDLPFHLREPGHGADRHISVYPRASTPVQAQKQTQPKTHSACTSGLGGSASANCNSYKRRYVPSFFMSSSCGPISAVVPFSSTTIRSARLTVESR